MLVRSARRRQRHATQILVASFAQLKLPWLAPAQLRWSASKAATSSGNLPVKQQGNVRQTKSATQTRSLATAADPYVAPHSLSAAVYGTGAGARNLDTDDYIPWELGSQLPDAKPNLFQSSRPPVLLNTQTQPSAVINVQVGVTGTAKELLAHLHTSLSVGRYERAKAIIQRLMTACGPQSAETIYAHNTYLAHLLDSMPVDDKTTSAPILKRMETWVEKELRAKNVQPNARTLITMIRASTRALEDSLLDTTVKAYVDVAKSMGEDAVFEIWEFKEYNDAEYSAVEHALEDDLTPIVEPTREEAESTGQRTVSEPVDATTELSRVLSVEQKGIGLDIIKRTMKSLADPVDLPLTTDRADRNAYLLERQRRLEQSSVDMAVERWRRVNEDLTKMGIHTAMQTRPMGALMWQWYEALVPALEQELEKIREVLDTKVPSETDRKTYGPYFEMLSASTMAAATILSIVAKFTSGKNKSKDGHELGISLASVTTGLGRLMEEEAAVSNSCREPQRNSVRSKTLKTMKNRKPRNKARRVKAAEGTLGSGELAVRPHELEWPLVVKVKLGAILVSKLIETAQMPVTREHPRTKESVTSMQPAFIHGVQYTMGRKTGVLMPNEALIEKLRSEPTFSSIAKRMPMVVPPKPWSSWKEGGYLHYPNPIMRLPIGDKSGKDYFKAADAKDDLDTLYQGLTCLSQVPWKINKDVFKVQLEAWNTGKAIANFPPLHPDLQIPPEPERSDDANAHRKWLSLVRELKNKEAGIHSQRCFQNLQMEIARTMVNETLYFPHNLDFRGRAYPIPPYLNHMGADNARGVLVFAEGKPLGAEGLRWLKIHLATAAGYDKASMDERIEYTMSHLPQIRDSVEHPLDGERWWLQAEDAWQTLAACFELIHALDSPDPEKFVSHLPIQQDGTCNGLQHYAALGGDKIGAAQVNLEPGDRPADVYTAVAEIVKDEIRKDAAAGNAVAQKLDGRITRKCVKQPVMTNVYGVTFYGARLQVAKQLEVLFPEVDRRDPIVNIATMSEYVARKIFLSLDTMFGGAQAIQNWLGQCADRITTSLSAGQIDQLIEGGVGGGGGNSVHDALEKRKRKAKKANAEGGQTEVDGGKVKPASTFAKDFDRPATAKPFLKSSVVWTTPLRLPVVQPYRTTKSRSITTNLQYVSLQEPQVWEPINRRKQLQAFPPNFIHSLDATHMILSALGCAAHNITFASVHDSFWTHACDVATMSTVLRDQFIAMHREDVIGRLREEFITRYSDSMQLVTLKQESPLGQKVTQFRKELHGGTLSTDEELKLERQRMKLLASEDPKKRAKGEAMRTVGSMLAAAQDAELLPPPVDMKGQTLGAIPESEPDEVVSQQDDAALVSEATLDSLNEKTVDEEVEEEDELAAAEEDDVPEKKPQARRMRQRHAPYSRKLYVWVPLTLPPVPEKGDFDVTRLRESKYFFH